MNRLRIKPVSLAALAAGLALLAAPYGADAKAIFVNNGESIQDAVDSAPAGGTVIVRAGTYMETHGNAAAVRITKPLKLIAKVKKGEQALLVPGPGNTEGIMIDGTAQARIQKVMIKGFTIMGFEENGIWPRYAEKFKVMNNTVGDSNHVGIYPYLAVNGLVKNNVAFGGMDAALWVAGSEGIRVIRNEVYGAPTGLEVTTSKDVKFVKNLSHSNSIGLGLYHENQTASDDEDGLPEQGMTGTFIANTIRDNNMPNPVTSGSVADIPPGLGILVFSDGSTFKKNVVTGNGFAGIALVNYALAVEWGAANPKPDNNRVIKNTFLGNGLNPPDHPFAPVANDVAVIDAGEGNCASGNIQGTGPLLSVQFPPC